MELWRAQHFRKQGHLPSSLNKGFCEQVFKHEMESFGCGMKHSSVLFI